MPEMVYGDCSVADALEASEKLITAENEADVAEALQAAGYDKACFEAWQGSRFLYLFQKSGKSYVQHFYAMYVMKF
ncbi:hypothetical protein SASPL_147345 [Salvia splendens]|uniref:Uncharacterized protein n=1 Tax=Salvia splendens TaxID=180675 RepID=A0A8X8WDV6_SALSN|nr:hypothetical protein SASPL_147345 [Salvia splendens]